jgi:hypothetical protein
MMSLFPPRESIVVSSRLGMGNSRTFFYGVYSVVYISKDILCYGCALMDSVFRELIILLLLKQGTEN